MAFRVLCGLLLLAVGINCQSRAPRGPGQRPPQSGQTSGTTASNTSVTCGGMECLPPNQCHHERVTCTINPCPAPRSRCIPGGHSGSRNASAGTNSSCDFMKMVACMTKFQNQFTSNGTSVDITKLAQLYGGPNEMPMDNITHANLCRVSSRALLGETWACVNNLCDTSRNAMRMMISTSMALLKQSCQPVCRDYVNRVHTVKTCANRLLPINSTSTTPEEYCRVTNTSMSCSWNAAGDCPLLKMIFGNIFNESYIRKVNKKHNCMIVRSPEMDPAHCVKSCYKSIYEKLEAMGIDTDSMMGSAQGGKQPSMADLKKICSVVKDVKADEIIACMYRCSSPIPGLGMAGMNDTMSLVTSVYRQTFGTLQSGCKVITGSICPANVSSECLKDFVESLKRDQINLDVDDFPKLLELFDQPPVDQNTLNKICSKQDLVEEATNASSCLKLQMCRHEFELVNKTTMGVQFLCESGCKDDYFGKVRRFKACMRSLNESSRSYCSDITSAWHCVMNVSKGCKIFEHHLQKKFSPDWLKYVNHRYRCNIPIPGMTCGAHRINTCLSGLVQSMVQAGILININDVPNLLPGQNKSVPAGAQDIINKFCRNMTDIGKAHNTSLMCLRTNKCLETLKRVSMTAMGLKHICESGCKDKYLEKMRKLKACFSKMDKNKTSCSDLESAMTCAKKEAEGCKILIHHLMKWRREAKEWHHCPHKDGKKGTCPKVRGNGMGICVQKCNQDSDCVGMKKCCSNGCGHVCMQPEHGEGGPMMACKKKRDELMKDNKKGPGKRPKPRPGQYMPQCTSTGEFEPRQCHASSAYCWCVNKRDGKERQGTRHRSWENKDCDCKQKMCRNRCPYGYAVSDAGCQTCSCKPGPCEMNSCKTDQVCRVKAGQAECHDLKQENMCPRPPALPICGKGCPKKGCGKGMACCDVGCKRGVCLPFAMSPHLTECEKAQVKVIKMIKRAGYNVWDKPEMFGCLVIPRCKSDGSWHPTQCSPAMGTCWCVNATGDKIDKTERRGRVNCTSPTVVREEKVCPSGGKALPCSPMLCFGKKCHAHKDEDLVCRVNPCGDTCQVEFYNSANEKVNCEEGLSKCEIWRIKVYEKLKMHSKWLIKMMESGEDFKMPKDWKMRLLRKAEMYKAAMEHFLKHGRVPKDKMPKMVHYMHVCHQPVERGPCRGARKHWAYNHTSMMCEEFTYGGCLGNENNFRTIEECQQTCDMKSCDHDSVTGHCKAKFLRYFYKNDTKRCESFIYGGCGGNNNNYKSEKSCNWRCTVQPMRKFFMPMCNKMNKESHGFSYKQCHDDHCWCVDKDFNEVPGTLTKGHLKCTSEGRDASSSPPSVCTNEAEPRACVRECLMAKCGGVKEAVICIADPCNNCTVKFVSAITSKEVKCKRDNMDMKKDKPKVMPCAARKCDNKPCKPCDNYPEADCMPDTCTGRPVYYDPVTMEKIQCDKKVHPLCVRDRASKSKMKGGTLNRDIHIPDCNKKGRYKARQCDSQACWCVDARGEPVQGTRKPVTDDDDDKPVCSKKKIKKLKASLKINAEFEIIRDQEAFVREIGKAVKVILSIEGDELKITIVNLTRGSIQFDVVIESRNDTDIDLATVSNTMENKVGTGKMTVDYEGKSYSPDPASMEMQFEQVDEENKECEEQTCKCAYGYKYKMEEECRVCECLPNPCSVVKCASGHICQVNRDIRCIREPCNPVAECKDIKSASCPNMEGRVGICLNSCKNDSDCDGMKKCCFNGCGKDCMLPEGPKNSTCEKHQMAAIKKLHIMHAVMLRGTPILAKPVMIPRCTDEGDFEDVQCMVPYGLCWCVNKKTGEKITNTLMRGKPDCSKPDDIESLSSPCPAGVTVQTCHPLMCAKAHCRANPKAQCHINPCGDKCSVEFYNDDNEKVNCYAGVNMCTKRRDKTMYMKMKRMPMGEFRVILNATVRYLLHKEGVLEEVKDMVKHKMIKHSKPCEQPVDVGRGCEMISTRYYFNKETRRCEQFVYGGCDGNKNNFETRTQCEQMCDPHICHLDKEIGTCTDFARRWYFDNEACNCKPFDYGGCSGNSNNFVSEQMCHKRCGHNPMYGVPAPQCHNRADNDGFLWKQCHGRHCWCLDQNQNPINETLTEGRLTCSSSGRVSAESDQPIVCNNSTTPKVCHLTCLHATCLDKMENLTCSADPCNDCAVTFYKPGSGKDSWEKVKCQKKDDDKEPPATACKTGLAKCRDECSAATCKGFNESFCVQDPCNCKIRFLDLATRKTVNCNKIASLCERKRVNAMMQWDKTATVPTCEGATFKPQQCSAEHCWCVDDRGLEVKNTRVSLSQTANCKKKSGKKASLSIKIKADFNKIKAKEETFRWNFKFHFAKVLDTEMKYIIITKISPGSVLVDFEVTAQGDEDLASKMQFLESQVRIGNVSIEHEGERLVVDKNEVAISLDYTGTTPTTTEAPPSEDNMKQTIIIAVICSVIGVMLVIAVVIAIIKTSPGPSKSASRYKCDPEGYNNHAYGSYDDSLPGKNGHMAQ